MPDPLGPGIGSLEPPPRLDALLPPEMAKRAEEIGVKKASMDGLTMLTLAVLAGAFIWPDPGYRRRRGALHGQQPDRDGVGRRPRADNGALAELEYRLRR